MHLLTVHSACGQPQWIDRSRRRMLEVEEFMREHLADPLTLADLAAVVHLSQYHFARTFRDALGVPPRQRLTELRLERAIALLCNSDLSVGQIAVSSGFRTTARLTAAVRRTRGTTPTLVRANALRRAASSAE